MNQESVTKFIFNCFLLVLPVLAWNFLLTDHLPQSYQPEVFWKDIPPFLAYSEDISRMLVFAFTLLMPIGRRKSRQKMGLLLYISGLLLYFGSWVALIYFPESLWSQSLPGFAAPAYTPLLWLAGIGLIADSFYFELSYKPAYFIAVSILFLLFHNIHTCIIYFRIYG